MHAEDMQDPRHNAYWDLRGVIGQWMDASEVHHERALLSLARLTAELRYAEDCHVLARLQALELAMQEEDPPA